MKSGWGAGFTLVELFLVISLMAVMTAIAVPRFKKTTEGLRLKNTAFNLYKLALSAQESAVTQGRDVCIHFQFKDGTYQLLKRTDGVFGPAEGRWAKKMRVPEGVSLKGKTDDLVCFSDGHCEPASFTISGEGGRYELSIENLGGTVRIREVSP